MLSYKIVFSLDLRMKTVSSRLLSCTSYATFFYWPSTFGTKIHTVGELKTTIQALFCNSCTHHLDFAIDSNCNFNWSATFRTKIRSIREPKTTIQAPLCDSCSHHLFLFYRLGLYLFSTSTFKKHNPIYMRRIAEQLHITLTNLPFSIPKPSQKRNYHILRCQLLLDIHWKLDSSSNESSNCSNHCPYQQYHNSGDNSRSNKLLSHC